MLQKKAAKKPPPSAVLKPQVAPATTTPARPAKKPRTGTTSKPAPVTPSPEEDDDDSTEITASGSNLANSALIIPETSQFGVRGTEFDFDQEDRDNCSVLTEESTKEVMSGKGKKKGPTAIEKQLKEELQANQRALEEQGLRLQLATEQHEALQAVLKEIKGTSTLKKQVDKMTRELAFLRTNIKSHQAANNKLASSEKELLKQVEALEAQIKDLEAQIKDLQGQISNPQANGQPIGHNEQIQKLKLDLNEAQATVERFKSKFMTVHVQNNKNTETIATLQHQIRELQKKKSPTKDQSTITQATTAATARAAVTVAVTDETLVLDLEKLKKENKHLTTVNETLRVQLTNAKKALKKAGKSAKDEVVEGVLDIIKTWIKEVGYRSVRFVVGEDQQVEFCRDVYDGIKGNPQLRFDDHTDPETYKDFDEFKRVYDASCRECLNKRRQYTQTLCQVATTGMFCCEFCAVSAYALCHLP